MGKIILFLFTVFTFFLPVNETKKVTINYAFPEFKEVFYVLKSDSSVRHGSYTLFSKSKVLIQGYYKMGKRDSLWVQYDTNGAIHFTGSYADNRRIGIWDYYNSKAELEQKINFTTNEIPYYTTQFLKHPFRIFRERDTLVAELERPPLYVGGSSKLKEQIDNELTIPLHKTGERIQGTVYIEFMIDTMGKTSGHRVLKGIGRACDGEALRVLQTLPDDWMPGIFDGKPVSVQHIMQIVFDQTTQTNVPFSPIIKK
jgi:protein TonB